MKQATVKLPSWEYLFQEVPGVGVNFALDFGWLIWKERVADTIHNFGALGTFATGLLTQTGTPIPPGNWQLLGADPTNLTEEEAGEIVEETGAFFKDYTLFEPVKSYYFGKDTATESLNSLAESLGIEKPFVILKNVEK